MWLRTLLCTALFQSLTSGTASTWPILGPGYPPPRNVSNCTSPAARSWTEAISMIQSYLNGSRKLPSNQTLDNHVFSIAAFSAVDPEVQTQFQFHYASPTTLNTTLGTRQIDGDSLYRIGSVSKLFTVYLTLLKLGSEVWDRPVTDFVPQLVSAANGSGSTSIDQVDWTQVSLGTLAGQVSGITRGLINFDVLYPGLTGAGLPNETYIDPTANACFFGQTANCTEGQWLQQVNDRPPTYSPWSTAIYSNAAYDLLAIALEKATGQDFVDMMHKDLLQPLNLTSTGLGYPQQIENVVGVGVNLYTWNSFTGNETAAAGIYSSVNDMAKFGVSIMNSTLLSSLETRKWLKPIAHTSSIEESVGRPWEILRYTQPKTQRVNDLYTKTGDVLEYNSELVLSPDHQAGFVVLTAGMANSIMRSYLCDILGNAFLSGLEDSAAAEAAQNIAGAYRVLPVSTLNGDALNSSISFSVDPQGGPGLLIDSWINNGSDTLDVFDTAFGSTDWRLYPTDLVENISITTGNASSIIRRQAFRATIEFAPASELGIFSRAENRGTWLGVDGAVFRDESLDSFVFDFDDAGKAVSVTPSAFRVSLQKVS